MTEGDEAQRKTHKHRRENRGREDALREEFCIPCSSEHHAMSTTMRLAWLEGDLGCPPSSMSLYHLGAGGGAAIQVGLPHHKEGPPESRVFSWKEH